MNPQKISAHRSNSNQLFRLSFPNILLFIIAGFLLISPYAKGLFVSINYTFEKNMNLFLLFGFFLILSSAIILYKVIVNGKSHWIYYFIWLIPLSYLVSSITPISRHSSLNFVLLYSVYAALFIIGAFLGRKLEKWFVLSFMLSGFFITIFGLLHWFGLDYYQDAVNQGRLSSVFQYANTYAIYLVCILLSSVYLIVSKPKNWYVTLPSSLLIIPSIISFLLTVSRGALIVFPLLVLFSIIILPLIKQILYLIYLAISFIVAIILFQTINSTGLEVQQTFTLSKSFVGWSLLTLGSLSIVAASYLIQRFLGDYLNRKLERLNNMKWSRFFIPIAILSFSFIAFIVIFFFPTHLTFLPDSIQNRLANINLEQRSVLERFTFYQDTLKIFKDYPIVGAGGGAWSSAFQAYQSNPYVSREAHNYYVQYLSETGLIGFIILLVCLGYIFFRFICITISKKDLQYNIVFYIFACSILVHSLLDFNMSFIYISSIVFLCLGGMFAVSNSEIVFKNKSIPDKVLKVFPIIIGSVSILILIFAYKFVQGNQEYDATTNGLKHEAGYPVIMEHLDNAISSQPNRPEYNIMKIKILINVYTQTSDEQFYNLAIETINRLSLVEPFNSDLYSLMITLHSLKNNYTSALEHTEKAIALFPWNISFYNQAIISSYQLMEQSQTTNEKELYQNKLLSYYRDVEDKQNQILQLPEEQRQGTTFILDPEVLKLVNSIQE